MYYLVNFLKANSSSWEKEDEDHWWKVRQFIGLLYPVVKFTRRRVFRGRYHSLPEWKVEGVQRAQQIKPEDKSNSSDLQDGRGKGKDRVDEELIVTNWKLFGKWGRGEEKAL